jgi:CHRD domain
MRTRYLVVACGALAFTLAQSVGAAPPAARNFHAQLSGAQEVPARDTTAKGTAVFNLNPAGTELRCQVVVTGISNVVGSHIHSGVSGPIIFGMFDAPAGGGARNGVLAQVTVVRGTTALPASLGATLTNAERFDALVTLLRSGNTYVNVHTNDGVAPTNTGAGDFPGGEIRANIDATD